MAKKPTRLRFTEDDLADSKVKKAVNRADKAADKAEKAVDKTLPKKHRKLKPDADMSAARKAKLRHEKAVHEPEAVKPSRGKQMLTRSSVAAVSSKAHQAVSKYGDDNVGVQSVHESLQTAETAGYAVDHALYSHKLKAHNKADKMVKKSDKANVNAMFEKHKKDNPTASSNPLSKWRQKQAIKKEYAATRAGKGTSATASKGAKKAAQGAKSLTEKIVEFGATHSHAILIVLVAGILFMVVAGSFSSCSAMFQGGTQVMVGTSFTADEEDIKGANDDYKALENALREQINNIESTHSGYDEYRYDLDEINHNPYELTAYLTVLFEDFTRSEVQSTLQSLYNQQYVLTLVEEVEIRTRTETVTDSSTDPETGETTTDTYEVEVEYEYYILNVKLMNKGLGMVIGNAGLTEDQMERYRLLLETQGNRPDIFGDDIYAAPGGEYTDYDIPGEALTDAKFANMIQEAEKYLGYPYVWGGASPSTSFDCSGFVSWVINHSGNGWNYGRLTADGLKNICAIIPRSEAKPGDLIFFQGTYETSGASHVGIYVGNGMMIHCGNPISYASTETSYWQNHFYCFGRIPN
ncbi:MAG: NlpC/P60 family protein [Bacteroidia bacterium]|nr:NlpC/P60 family protein [Bacteroidia bacterium]